jgi:hypothetical protein
MNGEKRYLDFHALRASFISALAEAGIGPKELQELARHSDPRLTLGVYTQTTPKQLAGAVGKLPLPGQTPDPSPFAYLTREQLEIALACSLAALGTVFPTAATPVQLFPVVPPVVPELALAGDCLRLTETNTADGGVPVGRA